MVLLYVAETSWRRRDAAFNGMRFLKAMTLVDGIATLWQEMTGWRLVCCGCCCLAGAYMWFSSPVLADDEGEHACCGTRKAIMPNWRRKGLGPAVVCVL